MKKHLAFLLALLCALTLAGCVRDDGDSQPTPAEPEELSDSSGALISVSSAGESIEPYRHFAYSGKWVGGGFLEADGVPLSSALPELEASGAIPSLRYADDFAVILDENAEMRGVSLYDENLEPLDSVQALSDLSVRFSRLDAGEYYVGIFVLEPGGYIEEISQNEYTGWECVFRMTVGE